ncbi:hypothetical protein P5G51_008190 [Virgibacillus sp. 179-BFC.A HS]|uniref:Uncharacterized protein n=1 Tax=Tigheibacillus jepli TaxID=3035914 RepID=A0ABU5CGN5_9BACI|nr:hypothetical protein [Virgibacillus sp. 179-BFC.A HS]MDY0405380.1 hypothetical protein [Virgibacillus sp. 179-BFC.A HS]
MNKRLGKGKAVFWQQGEGHETFSKHKMTAIVIEGKELDPAAWMPQAEMEEEIGC